MSKDIKIKKGLTINLKGEAEKTLSKAPRSRTFAIRPADLHLTTPKMVVKEGAKIQAGETIFYSKNNEAIKFASPVSGTLTAIERGAKRVITRIVIEADSQDSFKDFGAMNVDSSDAEQIKNHFTTRSILPTNHILSSVPIPSIPVGIQWHHYEPLKHLDPLWFIQTSIFINKDSFTQLSDITTSNRHLLFHCITRIDLSNNSLECLPSFLFQMYSLKILNVSNNQLDELPNDNHVWLCHQLIELDVSHNALISLPSAMFQLRSLQRAYAGNSKL